MNHRPDRLSRLVHPGVRAERRGQQNRGRLGAGGTTPSVGAAPAALPAATADPIPANPEADASIPAGNASTNIEILPQTPDRTIYPV